MDFDGIVLVGGGIAGLATALALHRVGMRRILVLERAESLRASGTAIGMWSNGWKALDALGVGQILRHQHCLLLKALVDALCKVGNVNGAARVSEEMELPVQEENSPKFRLHRFMNEGRSR